MGRSSRSQTGLCPACSPPGPPSGCPTGCSAHACATSIGCGPLPASRALRGPCPLMFAFHTYNLSSKSCSASASPGTPAHHRPQLSASSFLPTLTPHLCNQVSCQGSRKPASEGPVFVTLPLADGSEEPEENPSQSLFWSLFWMIEMHDQGLIPSSIFPFILKL